MMKKIKLTQEKYVLVDDKDYEELNQFKWYVANQQGYWRAVRKSSIINGKQTMIYMHRVIMNAPKEKIVDHINHNTLDNRKINLRICTRSQNQYNMKPQKGISKYKGVDWFKITKKWRAQIRFNLKQISLGYFDDEIEAAKAYDKKAKELFGEFAFLNFKK